MTLGEALPVRAERHGHVGETGRFPVEGLEEQDVARRVGNVVLAPDHVADFHVDVVEDHRQVKRREPVRFHDDQVTHQAGVEGDIAPDQVKKSQAPVRYPETDRGTPSLPLVGGLLGGRQLPAAVVITGTLLPAGLLPAHPLQLLEAAVAVVSLPLADQPVHPFPVGLDPFRLAVGSVGAAPVGTLVPVQAKPLEVFQDHSFKLGTAPLPVGIFDPQDKRPLLLARQQVVEKGGPGITQVQVTGGTGCKSHSHPVFSLSLSVTSTTA
ncbi:MAG: hypothetical protein BWY73_00809 [candidate division TA06 bacterium ADurb.Bin417]|uniref:Uncharacterized protein n=1 Tax=candidate division TA06 bacterium ADurb.Bin417 TaxID=1852828 RepID=A0A1V5MGU2_UNCT6|nr:MAG: hypothetical protein BWY73_00809 [candidate division TA06 bacterium ADurb.Bin417]